MSSQNLEDQSSKATVKDPNGSTGLTNNSERSGSGKMREKRVVSDTTAPGDAVEAENMTQPPGLPNGGTQAWLQVIGAFVLFFNIWGLMNTFGVYQSYYELGELFDSTSSNISWIGSIQAFLMLFVGAITGPIFDAGHLRFLLCVGTFGVVFGHMMLSLVDKFWQALLAQAFVIGLGAGFLFVPSVGVIAQYFDTRLVTAMGLSVSGSSLGGIVYPIMFNKLIRQPGFPWAVRIIGLMTLGMLDPIVYHEGTSQGSGKACHHRQNGLHRAFGLHLHAQRFLWLHWPADPFLLHPLYRQCKRLRFRKLQLLLATDTQCCIYIRPSHSCHSRRQGWPAQHTHSHSHYSVIAVDNLAGMVAIAVFYGLPSGTYISLPPAIFVQLTPPEKRHLIGTRMGMGFTIMDLGILIGTPVAGAILGSKNYFTGVYLWSGTTLVAACLGFAVVRYMCVRFKLMAKV